MWENLPNSSSYTSLLEHGTNMRGAGLAQQNRIYNRMLLRVLFVDIICVNVGGVCRDLVIDIYCVPIFNVPVILSNRNTQEGMPGNNHNRCMQPNAFNG